MQKQAFARYGLFVNIMKENQKKAFDFAADTTKQLITISTAIITLTVSFSKDILGGATDPTKFFLIWTWGIFIISILAGLVTLMTLTGRLLPMKNTATTQTGASNSTPITPGTSAAPSTTPFVQGTPPQTTPVIVQEEDEDLHINHGNIRFFSITQVILFSVAIIMTGIFGYKSLNTHQDKHKNTYQVIRKSTLNNDTTKYVDTLYLEKK